MPKDQELSEEEFSKLIDEIQSEIDDALDKLNNLPLTQYAEACEEFASTMRTNAAAARDDLARREGR